MNLLFDLRGRWVDEWMDGWMDGLVSVSSGSSDCFGSLRLIRCRR